MERISEDVLKLNVDSNVYLFKKKLVIDTGPKSYKDVVREEVGKIVSLDKIEKVVFTHLHADHIGNFDLFVNAKFYASKESVEDFNKMAARTVLDPFLAKQFNKIKLNVLERLEGFKIIKTPGHSRGSMCLFYEKDKILFSGDTLFFNENIGRLDLFTSVPKKMQESLAKLKKLDYRILAPGHDYR